MFLHLASSCVAAAALVGSAAIATAASPENVPVRYPARRSQSPITASVAESMHSIVHRGSEQDHHVFMKVGDSITSGPPFASCFTETPQGGVPAGIYRDYGGRPLEAAVSYFSEVPVQRSHGSAALASPFERVSQTAAVAMDSLWLPGQPGRVDTEVADIHPLYAIVMFGTNDLGYGGSDAPSTDVYKFTLYPRGMMDTVDLLIERGVVPILLSIPPRGGQRYPLLVGSYNAVLRGLAEARQIPFADYSREMGFITSPQGGLKSDGVHPNAFTSPQYWPEIGCNLTPAALQYGYNVLNKVVIEALDRVRQSFEQDWTPLDPAGPERALHPEGAGSSAEPLVVDALPFTDVRDLRESPFTSIGTYGGCPGRPTASAPDYLYKLVLTETTPLRVFVATHGSTSLATRLSVLGGSPTGGACLATVTANPFLDGTFQPGTYYFAVDAASLNPTGSGEYMLGILPCDPADSTACTRPFTSGEPATPQLQIGNASGPEASGVGMSTLSFTVTLVQPGS